MLCSKELLLIIHQYHFNPTTMTYEEIVKKLETHNLYMGEQKINIFSKNSETYWHLYLNEDKPAIITPYTFQLMLEAKALHWKEKPNPLKEMGWEKISNTIMFNANDKIVQVASGEFRLQVNESTIAINRPTAIECANLHANIHLLLECIEKLSKHVRPEGFHIAFHGVASSEHSQQCKD